MLRLILCSLLISWKEPTMNTPDGTQNTPSEPKLLDQLRNLLRLGQRGMCSIGDRARLTSTLTLPEFLLSFQFEPGAFPARLSDYLPREKRESLKSRVPFSGTGT